MSGIFGTNPVDRPSSGDNPLGLDNGVARENGQPPGKDEMMARQALNSEGMQNTPEPQEQNVEPQPQQTEPQGTEPNQPQEPVEQQPKREVTPESKMEEKVEYITKKFENAEQLEKSMHELADYLGEDISMDNLDTKEKVVNKYIEMEEKKGRLANQKQQQTIPNREQLLEQDNQRLRAVLEQMQQAGLTNQNGMQNTPNNQFQRDERGRFVSQNQQQNMQQNMQQTPQQNIPENDNVNRQDMNMDEVVNKYINDIDDKDFWDRPKETVFKNVAKMMNEVMQKREQQMQQEQQMQAERRKQAEQVYNKISSDVEQVKQKYGEENFKALEPDIKRYINNNQYLLLPEFGNGIERAYQHVANMRQRNQQQNVAQQQNQKEQFRKRNADINNSNADIIPGNQNNRMNQEQIERMQIFGQPKGPGIFG